MTPPRIEVHGSSVFFFGIDDPYPWRLTAERAIEWGRQMQEAGDQARRNAAALSRVRPITTSEPVREET